MNGIGIGIAALQAAGPVTALTTKARIYPVRAPQVTQGQGIVPYLVVNLVGGRDPQLLTGAAGYYEQRLQIDCIGATDADALALGDVVLEALKSIVKQQLSGAVDVDIYFADTDFTEPADTQALGRRVLHFYVRWRSA